VDGSGLVKATPFPEGVSGWFSVRPVGGAGFSFPVFAFEFSTPSLGISKSVALPHYPR
jgi:hypothetical protein